MKRDVYHARVTIDNGFSGGYSPPKSKFWGQIEYNLERKTKNSV